MKKILLLSLFTFLLSCESDDDNRYCDIIQNVPINLNLPEFVELQTPGNWKYSRGSTKGLVIYNFGNTFKAFSRECPSTTFCAQKMNVVNNIKLVCPCDDAEFSLLDGSPQTGGITESVCEFRVIKVSSSVLNITNF